MVPKSFLTIAIDFTIRIGVKPISLNELLSVINYLTTELYSFISFRNKILHQDCTDISTHFHYSHSGPECLPT